MLKRILAVILLISIVFSMTVFSSASNEYIDIEEFSSEAISTAWKVTCGSGNIAKVNTDNQKFELNKFVDSEVARLEYVIPNEIPSGKVVFEFSFYMNGTDAKAIQIRGDNKSDQNIFLYMLTQNSRPTIRNEESGYTKLSDDILTKGTEYTFKAVIDFDASEENITTYINSKESSVKKGFQAAATAFNLKKISFYLPKAADYKGGGIVIDDFKIYTDDSDASSVADSYAWLDLGDTSAVSEDLKLPQSDDYNGTTIKWSSSRPEVITSSGVVRRSYFADEKAVLTAQLSKKGLKVNKTFEITVLKNIINNEQLNTDFENVSNINPGTNYWSGDKKPDVWSTPNKVDTPAGVEFTAEIDSEVKHSGEYSLKLGSSTEPARIMVSQVVTGLSPDKTYKLSGYIKTENYTPSALSSIGPVIQVLVLNTTNYYAATSIETATADWTYVENIFSPGTDAVRIDCNFVTGTGFAWFDDIKLEEYVAVQTVRLNHQNVVMNPGDTYSLSAELYPENSDNKVINWSSSDEKIVAVDENGVITAVGIKSGRAVISAIVTENICVPSTGGKRVAPQQIEGFCIVEVTSSDYDTAVSAIKLNKTKLELSVGDSGAELFAEVTPETAVNHDITWRSSDASVADVIDGMVIPKSQGKAIIYAEADSVTAECSVTVNKASAIPILEEKTYIQTANFDDIVTASGYPKLLFDMEDIERIRQTAKNQFYEKSYLTMAKSAYSYLTKTNSVHPKTASGGRVLNKRVSDLALIGYINKDMRYINKAIEHMIKSSDTYTAQDYKNMNGDIALGDAAHAYAVGYDWLYPFMTENQRKQIEDELDGLINELYNLLSKEETGCVPAVASNHVSVSAGGMGLAALVCGNQQTVIELAKERIIEYYKTSADSDGFSFEGISYYSYGLLGAATFNAALERAENIDLLSFAPDYYKTLDMLTYYVNPDGKDFVPIGDSSQTVAPSGGIIYLISKYKNETALWSFLRMTGDEGDRSYGGGDDFLGASIPYMLIFADISLEPQSPDDMPHGREFESGFVSMRDGWDAESSFMTFTSSAVPHRGHNQRDENSFTFSAFGEDFLIDPGYTPTETSSHNAVLINGFGQSVPGNRYDVYGSIEKCILYDGIGYIKGDASDTYHNKPEVSGVIREVLYHGGANPYMVVADDITISDDINANIQVLYQTDRNNKVVLNKNADEIKIIGSQNGAVMKITCPFNNSIMRTGNYEGRKMTGGRGEYVASDYSETIETLTNINKSTRIISLIMTSQSDKTYPEIETSGTVENGLIKIKFADGRTDYITITKDDIKLRSVKVDWKNDGDTVVTIGQSVNEENIEGEIYAVKYDGGKLSYVKTTEFNSSEAGKTYIVPFGVHTGEKSLFFWQKGSMHPVFDKYTEAHQAV